MPELSYLHDGDVLTRSGVRALIETQERFLAASYAGRFNRHEIEEDIKALKEIQELFGNDATIVYRRK